MPRTGRKHSVTGIYHVMLRGINRQDIFEALSEQGFCVHSGLPFSLIYKLNK